MEHVSSTEVRRGEPSWRESTGGLSSRYSGMYASGNERMPGPHRDQSEGQGVPRDRKARRSNNNEGGVKKRPGLLCKPVTGFPCHGISYASLRFRRMDFFVVCIVF